MTENVWNCDCEQKKQTLKKYFGYDCFRDGQEAIIDQILTGRDVMAVMPTGAGKSLCYQLPALLMPGITLVISPLISLMMDQVKALNEMGIHAAYINSSLSENQIAKALELAKTGRYKLIYVAPERLETPRFLDFANHAELSMVAVDEAHCISQWGQDFRPSYLRILAFVRQLPRRPVVCAFTATATRQVREDISNLLDLEKPYVAVTGFDRENLYFGVERTKQKKEKILVYLENHRKESGIIYCATRKGVDELYLYLEDKGFSVGRYHAGMDTEARKRSQEDFIYDRVRIMIATNAFGMGIDKSNVRYVLHCNMPQSMENYYQEAGRAGRDGEPAECILYYSPQDVVINRFLLESKEMDREYSQEELEKIQVQDAKRLHLMEIYCNTTKCLRSYILNYFGEETFQECQNCSNCMDEFEEIDVTQAVFDVLCCIKESGQRFGMNLIAGILLGENTAKIRNYQLNLNPAYGKQSRMGQKLVKEIIRSMVERGYLRQTMDKYALLKLTEKSEQFLSGPESFRIACRKEERFQSSRKKSGQTMDLDGREAALFEELRRLRSELAKTRSIPPYMVASDKTLRDMCLKMPLKPEEMLRVTGMGEKKLKQYGKAFLEKIRRAAQADSDSWESESAVALTASKPGRKKAEFCLTEEILQEIQYLPETSLRDFVEQINSLRDEKRMKRLTIKWLTEKLIEDGCLEERTQNGYVKVFVTEKGRETGIRAEERTSTKGNPYEVFFYQEQGQRYLVEILKKEKNI